MSRYIVSHTLRDYVYCTERGLGTPRLNTKRVTLNGIWNKLQKRLVVIEIMVSRTIQYTGFEVPMDETSDLDDVSRKDENHGEFPSSKRKMVYKPSLVIRVQTLHDGDLGFLQISVPWKKNHHYPLLSIFSKREWKLPCKIVRSLVPWVKKLDKPSGTWKLLKSEHGRLHEHRMVQDVQDRWSGPG